MGCDIHFFVEYRTPGDNGWHADERHKICTDAFIGQDGKFHHDPDYTSVTDLGVGTKTLVHEGKEYLVTDYEGDDPLAIHRPYGLFGFLADVRASMGTAIIPPRGIPRDVSDIVRKAIDDYGGDGHSHHYLSLEEFEMVLGEWKKSAIEDARQNHEESDWYENAYQEIVDYIKDQIGKKSYECEEGLFDTRTEARVVFFFDN